MVHAELTIINEQGIHLGPANKIANLADRYDCQIHFKTEYMDVNAKSIINLISGTFRQGDVIQCVCDGPDEKEALEANVTVPYRFAPAHLNRQSASAVAALGVVYYKEGKSEDARDHKPIYLRQSQAERERALRLKGEQA